MNWNAKSALILFAVLLYSTAIVKAQQYQYHKIYIYNFTKYIQWPAEKQAGDFVIGVYGKSQMMNELVAMSQTRSVGSQKIVVKQIDDPAGAAECHVLFLPEERSSMLQDIKTKIGTNPTLLITEKQGMGKQGSSINFVIIDGKLKYELNKTSIDKAGLKVMPDLIKLAILVNS